MLGFITWIAVGFVIAFIAPTFIPQQYRTRPLDIAARGGEPVPAHPLFAYLAKGETFQGEGIDQFRVGFNAGYDPTYTWDPATKTWKRSYGGAPFTDTSGNPVAPNNVIVTWPAV